MASSFNPEPSSNLSSSSTPKGRVNVIQGLRAVAVLLVVWTHAIVAASYHSTSKQDSFFHLKGFGACGLDIFFVISGFIVTLVAVRTATNSASTFLARRITRIFPLYWILTLVVVLVAELGRYPIQWHRVPWVPTVFLLPPWHYPVPPLILSLGWSLLFEIYFYLVLTVCIWRTPKHIVRNTVVFLLAMVALGAAIGLHRPLLVIWSSPVALEFVLGCLIARLYTKLPAQKRRAGPALAALGAIALAVTIFTGYGAASEASSILAGLSGWLRLGVWGVPSALLVLGAVLWSPAMHSTPARLLIFLGDASYSIYLSTNPARSMVEHFWRFFGQWGGDIGVFLCAATCILIGVVCYLVVERPLMRFFHNWYKPIPFPSSSGKPVPTS